MAATVVVSAFDVLQFPLGGGHFSAYLQYVHGLYAHGCEVWWMERVAAARDPQAGRRVARELSARLRSAGLPDRLIVYAGGTEEERSFLAPDAAEAEAVIARADLLVNFHYEMDAELLARFRRTALIDIDPGLLQLWIGEGHLHVHPHDRYFTTGETVGTPAARFPSCGLDWIHIRPPVSIEHWPLAQEEPKEVFTTVSSWWSEEYVRDGHGEWHENNKRVSFLEYLELPKLVPVPLELALNVYDSDAADIALLERNGWRVRPARKVTGTPAEYRSYVRCSAGEFSCAKPSCMLLQNAWVSDRTICYLASGRPAVVQDTGPSSYLDGGHGILRFSSLEQAAEALEGVRSDYRGHAVAARQLAVTHFDAAKVVGEILESALSC
jgi:hypothetical protein